MLSVADALSTVLARVPALPVEHVPLHAAVGRVLAADIVATRMSPGFDNSAMDGYAVRAAELPATLPLAGIVGAGDRADIAVPPGHAIRIFTGAPLPPGVDTVVIQEDVNFSGDRVVLPAAPVGDNVRRAGDDIALGQTVLTRGTRLVPWHTSVLAALGVAVVPVARRPRVAIVATGDELVTVEQTPGPGQLVDSSAHVLAALITEAGGEPVPLGIARDELGAIAASLTRALEHDVVITTGGVSVGDRDFVHAALAQVGVTRELYKVAMKPGKPFAFGTRGQGLVFGLPGNPVSTIVAFELFLRPALLAMQGAVVVERPRVPVVLATGYRKPAGRAHYVRARVVRDRDRLVAEAHPKQGSAMLSSLVACNALVEIGAEVTDIPPGAPAGAILFEAV